MVFTDMQVRRRSVRRLWRRLDRLASRVEARELPWSSARGSIASWLGLAKHADAFRLSRAFFDARDVRNIGKRLLVQTLAPQSAASAAAVQHASQD